MRSVKNFLRRIVEVCCAMRRKLHMSVEIEKCGLTCCFCNEGIACSNMNPCDISIIARADRPEKDPASQIFWCHIECFRDKMCPEARCYFMLDLLLCDNDETPAI